MQLDEVEKVVFHEYGITCSCLKVLYGYEDKNYWLEEAGTKKEFAVRITLEKNFITKDFEDDIDQVQDYLVENGFNVSTALKTNYNQRRHCYVTGEGTRYHFRISPFLSGKSIAESNLSGRQIPQVAGDVGELAGLFHKCLSKYPFHFQYHKPRGEDYVWYTANFDKVEKYTSFVQDLDLKKIVNEILCKYKDKIYPLLPMLRQGIVHGDFSHTNLIINQDFWIQHYSIKKRIGIIDFEDIHIGPFVLDLAISMAYLMTSVEDECFDQLAVAGIVLANYQKVFPMLETEKKVLYYGVLARLSTCYVMCCYFKSIHPENADYYNIQSSKCPSLIKTMFYKGEEEILSHWLNGVLTKDN